MVKLIDGKALARNIGDQIKERVYALKDQGVATKLAVIMIGDNPASNAYVGIKLKRAAELGITVEQHRLADDISEEDLYRLIDRLNRDICTHGILVQLPLPDNLDTAKVLANIAHEKDVDGMHSHNAVAMLTGHDGLMACTPKGIAALIKSTREPIEGKRCVVVGRSNLVGKPTADFMLREGATITMCHSCTKNLGSFTKEADILISAAGCAGLIVGDMVKEGAMVIDVGQSWEDGVWRGDVDFESVSSKASYITPTPGGVGPMTIIMLMDNTVEAAERSLSDRHIHGA